MTRLMFLILLVAIFSCNSGAGEKLTDNNSRMDSTVLTEMKESSVTVNYDTIPAVETIRDSVKLFFESDFKKDKITIIVDGKKAYSDIISTDHTIGIAKIYMVKRGKIQIKLNNLNNTEIKHANNNYVRIQFINDKIKIIVTDQEPMYK